MSVSERTSQVHGSVLDAIGNTPVVRLQRLFRDHDVVAKLEFMNPGGSIKDRMVRYMLRYLPAGVEHVVESSSGNTGAALAMAAAVRGLRCDVTVPDRTSTEKIRRIEAYGAQVHMCASSLAEAHEHSYYSMAESIAAEHGAFHLDQYRSALNRQAHYTDTAPELWFQLDGRIDCFVCGIGSGGTISGIGRFLKERDRRITVIGVEPLHSSYREAVTGAAPDEDGTFGTVIEGVGKRAPSGTFDAAVVDDVIQVPDDVAVDFCHRLAREEGILAGGSSGCVAAGIARLLPRLSGRVVTVFPDSGANYLSKYF
ncbi:PLP-dependent cysteine synthase family protein [Pseudoduganella umbonata]|uniref:Cystathionine beta-synthase n=1 Tax=Pseudoduganella umbonata TaxID=864828 RepID=A0A4P8HPM9_9BURK|nr:cysteine synthase family protein [Pseudoduganella umbonata]MBB3220839.1 cystathionine beta-synthase [Pseudoduganella umbonata]QCP11697.1 cysteine synthase family protein [Pseudoduganella umbonata]